MRFGLAWGRPRSGNLPAPPAQAACRGAMLHYRCRMSDRPSVSRPVAIALLVMTVLAFVAILVGLAVGQLAVAGMGGFLLVVMWFAVLGFGGRGRG